MGEAQRLTSASAGGFLARFATQRRIIHALMLREMMTRFGRENLGFFWLMGEPLILSVMVMLGWTVMKGSRDHDVGVIPFVLTGYAMLTLWRHINARSVHCFRQNAGLLFHRNVHPLDTLISRVLLETGGGALSFIVAYVPLRLFEIVPEIHDYLVLIGAWILLACFAFGFAMILAALSEMNELVERFIQPVMYVTIPLTGAFYLVEWLPAIGQRVALYSPLVHANEMFRAGLFGPEIATHWDASFLGASALVVNSIGIALVLAARKHLKVD